ncbi:hypothetical protein KI387_010417, partial [Taxus chinensis]
DRRPVQGGGHVFVTQPGRWFRVFHPAWAVVRVCHPARVAVLCLSPCAGQRSCHL